VPLKIRLGRPQIAASPRSHCSGRRRWLFGECVDLVFNQALQCRHVRPLWVLPFLGDGDLMEC
jgi:hypothetical protein